jgi:hypothetical protein
VKRKLPPKAFLTLRGSVKARVLPMTARACILLVGVLCTTLFWGCSRRQPEAALDEVSRSVTNLISLPLEEGVKIISVAAEKEHLLVITNLDRRRLEIQAEMNTLQSNKPASERMQMTSEQQALVQQFQKETAQTKEQLNKVRRRMREQIEALERLKGVTNSVRTPRFSTTNEPSSN